ncbi:MAG: hypothetical protein KGL35_24370 [Bradyrhizobium sp.]|nr:hypothetical protein [Bradyrhizobium sp.]
MNLHGLVSGAVGVVNPFVKATIQVSTGYTIQANGKQVPTYDPVTVLLQVQALTYTDIMKLDGLNIQGVRRAIYTNGFYGGIIRDKARGGDLIVFPAGMLPEGDTWLLNQELETWPDWVKFAITLQNGA